MATSGVSAFSSTGELVRQLAILHLMQKECMCSSFSCWNVRFKNEVCACSGSASEAMVWIKEVEIVDSVTILKIVKLKSGTSFHRFRGARCEDCYSPEKDLPEFILQKGHTRGAESSFAGSISLRTSDCFYDLQVLPSCCF